jgi:hypothetical protein
VTRLHTARRPRSRLARCHAHVGLLRSRVCVCLCQRLVAWPVARRPPVTVNARSRCSSARPPVKRAPHSAQPNLVTHTPDAAPIGTGECATDVCPCRRWCGLALLCSAPIGFASVYSDKNIANCQATCGSDGSCLMTCENQCRSTLASCDAACGDSTAKIMKQ